MSFVQKVQNLESCVLKDKTELPSYPGFVLLGIHTVFGKWRFWQLLIPHQSAIANDSQTDSTKVSITEV